MTADAALQLAFAPAVVAALAILAKGATTVLIIVAAAIALLSLGVGLWRLSYVNSDYVTHPRCRDDVSASLSRAVAALDSAAASSPE